LPNSGKIELILRIRCQILKVLESPVEALTPTLVSKVRHIAEQLQIALRFGHAVVISGLKLD